MKTKKMPTTIILLIFSWLIALAGLLKSLSLIVFHFKERASLFAGLWILLSSLLLAAVIRMFANIGQMIFDLIKEVQFLKNDIEQINCDTKDANENIHQIKGFFEQIEKHLELKK